MIPVTCGKCLGVVFYSIQFSLSQGVDEVQKQQWVQKGMNIGEEVSKTAKGAAEKISKQGEEFTKSRAYQTVSEVRNGLKEVELRSKITSRKLFNFCSP